MIYSIKRRWRGKNEQENKGKERTSNVGGSNK